MKITEKINKSRYTLKNILSNEWNTLTIQDYSLKEIDSIYSNNSGLEQYGYGFICNLNGEKTNQIIHDALEILIKLKHRGGVSSDGVTGDGAGLLIDIPHSYFKKVCEFDSY